MLNQGAACPKTGKERPLRDQLHFRTTAGTRRPTLALGPRYAAGAALRRLASGEESRFARRHIVSSVEREFLTDEYAGNGTIVAVPAQAYAASELAGGVSQQIDRIDCGNVHGEIVLQIPTVRPIEHCAAHFHAGQARAALRSSMAYPPRPNLSLAPSAALTDSAVGIGPLAARYVASCACRSSRTIWLICASVRSWPQVAELRHSSIATPPQPIFMPPLQSGSTACSLLGMCHEGTHPRSDCHLWRNGVRLIFRMLFSAAPGDNLTTAGDGP